MNLTRFLRPAPLALGALLVLAPTCPAAQPPAAAAPAQTAPVNPFLVTVDFPGGPLSKLLATINAGRSQPVVLINTVPGLDPVLPAFAVQNEQPASVLGVIGTFFNFSSNYRLQVLSPSLAMLVQLEERKDTGFVAFQIATQLQEQSIDQIVAAIQSAYAFAEPGSKPDALRFKFHPGTKMLFVAGPQRGIDLVVRQVIQSLPARPVPVSETPKPQS